MTEWKADELPAFRLFNAWAREQALAIFAWDKASVAGTARGPRPVVTDPFILQSKARAEAK